MKYALVDGQIMIIDRESWRYIQVGDLVWGREHEESPGSVSVDDIGVVTEVIDHLEVPPVVKVLWSNGTIDKEWINELWAVE